MVRRKEEEKEEEEEEELRKQLEGRMTREKSKALQEEIKRINRALEES